MLFLDSPAGVGFSYSDNTPGNLTVGDKRTAEETYTFLIKWLRRFPQYKNRPFYIAGESYAGHYIPELAQVIVRRNKGVKKPIINFKGLLLHNPLIDDHYDSIGTHEYWWNHGLISDSTYKKLRACPSDSFLFPSGECYDALSRAYNEFGDIDPYSIYGDTCIGTALLRHNLRQPLPFTFRGSDECLITHTKKYMNNPKVQKALHANVTRKIPYPWAACSAAIYGNWSDSPKSMLPIFKELIAAGVRIWIVSGDTDAIIPLTATRYSINALKLDTYGYWYAWVDDKGEVGGWSQRYKGLTYATVRGAGHEVPFTQPQRVMVLFRYFLRNLPLPASTVS